ncbi:hypothetical protein M5E06_17515 [Azospirillum sp. A1-3]|uniref:hypothetical protein n=1 Tax=Azospirillum sp. A1-3 TaxID=185874 RepID=UPI00207762E5|nr:hypothetical protein [Azospirillum sp. A1-3]MCM8735933.1 hypothetical protein [Azospirillum sp. A1-3]
MVQIDVEQWDAVRKARKIEAGELTEAERALLGRAVRIELPVTDLPGMKQAADMLIGLGTQIKFIAEREDMTKAEKLFAMRSYANSVRDRLRVSSGRPKRTYDKF